MRILLCTLVATTLTSLASAQITPYSQDFEGLVQGDPAALHNDGWLAYGNVFDTSNNYLYGYVYSPTPNGGGGFCEIASGNGGPAQGAQQLEIYSDYNNADQALGYNVEANTYQEWIIAASDVGKTYKFTFDVKLGDLQAPSQAFAFIKVINNTTFDLSGFDLVDTTNTATTWTTYSIFYTPAADQVGHFFQIGFLAFAANYDPSGVFYDNIVFDEEGGTTGNNYCISTSNSTGSPSVISATGSSSIGANDLVLSANNLPSQPGIFIAGPTQAQIPFFNGFLCIDPNGLQRFVTVNTPAGGMITEAVDIATSSPGGLNVVAGSSYNYQRWNRDPAAGGGNANFSDGLEVMYAP